MLRPASRCHELTAHFYLSVVLMEPRARQTDRETERQRDRLQLLDLNFLRAPEGPPESGVGSILVKFSGKEERLWLSRVFCSYPSTPSASPYRRCGLDPKPSWGSKPKFLDCWRSCLPRQIKPRSRHFFIISNPPAFLMRAMSLTPGP